MDSFACVSRPWLFGRDRASMRRFVAIAIGLGVLTAGMAALGNVLLQHLPRLYAHLVIESAAVLVFVGTVGLAITNAYRNGGILTTTLVTSAPVVGLFGYLGVTSTVLGATTSVPITLDVLISLGAGIGAISIGSYLLGVILYLQQTSRLGPVGSDRDQY